MTWFIPPSHPFRVGIRRVLQENHKKSSGGNKHGSKCAALGYDFLPAAFTSFGGWGEAIMKVLQKEYHAKKKQEKKSGGARLAGYGLF